MIQEKAVIKARIWHLIGMMGICVTVIFILFKVSKAPNTYSNGFKRIFNSTPILIPTYYRDLHSNQCYLAGQSGKSIYVGSYQKPDELLCMNDSFTTLLAIHIPYNTEELSTVKSSVDSPELVIGDRQTGCVVIYDIDSKSNNLQKKNTFQTSSFGIAQLISSSSFIFQRPDSTLKRNILIKTDFAGHIITRSQDALQRQIDGFFCTDGMINFDPRSKKILYVYFYRNEFITLDTNLSIQYRGHTIDTNRLAKITVSELHTDNTYTFSAPPVTCNQQSCTGNGLLFVRSGLLADHEDRQVFGKSSVIDAYRIADGRYQFSFHILDFDGFKISDFMYTHNHFVAIEGHYIVYCPLSF